MERLEPNMKDRSVSILAAIRAGGRWRDTAPARSRLFPAIRFSTQSRGSPNNSFPSGLAAACCTLESESTNELRRRIWDRRRYWLRRTGTRKRISRRDGSRRRRNRLWIRESRSRSRAWRVRSVGRLDCADRKGEA